MQTKAGLIAGGLLYIFYSQHSCKYNSTPFIRALPSLLSGQIRISNDSKILLNPPLKRGHSYFKEAFKLQKRWSYKKGTTVIVNYLPSREATPIWRQLFHCRRSGLIRGGYCNSKISPLTRNHPYLKATFSLQKEWSYNRETAAIVEYLHLNFLFVI